MDLFTLKGMKQKYGSFTDAEVRSCKEEMEARGKTGNLFDIYLLHSMLPDSMIYMTIRMFREKGYSVYADTWTSPEKGKHSRSEIEVIMRKCHSLVITGYKEQRYTWEQHWQIGYFSSFRNRVAVLPILKKDVNSNVYKGEGICSWFPYIGTGIVFMENREALWVMQDPKRCVDFTYWLEKDPGYIEW